MKILILNWRDIKHPLSGGAETMLYHHAQNWKKKGATITWFSSSFHNSKEKETNEGITYIRHGSHYTVQLFGLVYLLLGKLDNQDIIIDCFHFIPFFTPLVVSKKRIVAVIHEIAGKVWFRNSHFPISTIGYYLEPLLFKIYKNIPFITVSNSTKEDLVKLGIQKKDIRLIYNGIVSRIDKKSISKEKKPTFIYLGRISKDKGIRDAIKSFELVLENVPNAVFWIVGKEERFGDVDDIINSELKVGRSKIKYWGFVSEKVKYELLQKAWILVHPSQKEGWGLTVIEAASCGTPTVGYNVEGLRDSVVNNKTGILVEENPRALSIAIIDLIVNQKKLHEMKALCINWATKFNWEKSTEESWRLMQSI